MVSRKIEQLSSKNGLPILQVEHEGRKLFIHSKYDPVKEAEQILSKYEGQIDQFNHFLFYGVGLGYHVKSFMERYPDKIVSTYEPIVEVAEACTAAMADTKLPISKLKYAFVENESEDMERHLYTLSNHLSQNVLLIVLPTYQSFLKEDVLRFIGKFKEIVEEKKITLHTNDFFSKRWTINSLMNLPSTFENPNFLLEHKDTFRDKPVILVAAGPSLNEEMDNLRTIKEQGTAYIFAVGSANKALIAQGIHPDAVFTYDPQSHNYTVFQPIIDEGIQTIPLIYGTSVGFETIERYPGPKFHFLTAQDTITQLFHETVLPVIKDAYSIAIVTLELLYHLQVRKIILVGQNFAFKNDLFYSEEIARYDKELKTLSDASVQKDDLKYSFTVPDIHGNEVLTNKKFNNMRELMEKYIVQNPQIPVVNTTRGGAAIAGTTYHSLTQLMAQELTESIVTKGWYEQGQSLPISMQTIKELKRLQQDIATYIKQNEDLFEHFSDIEKSIDKLNRDQIHKRLAKLDELMRKLTANTVYERIIYPITRNLFERLGNEVEIMRDMEPTKEKLVKIVNLFAQYLHSCREVYKEVALIIQTVVCPAFIHEVDKKEWVATSGMFEYKGEWEKQNSPKEQMPADLTEDEKGEWHERKRLEDKIDFPISSIRTTEKNASFTFRFSGTSLTLYGTNHAKGILKLRVIIDNKITNLTMKDGIDEKLYGSFIYQELFQTTHLKDGLHIVTLELLSDNVDFSFQGIEIDKSGRAYHIDEVTTTAELVIGKRIRCHYKATYNTVGEFSGFGEESESFLSVEASANPDGDFYFIMVDEVDGEKKLIADRCLQNYISWEVLRKEEVLNSKRKTQLNVGMVGTISLMSGGSLSVDDVKNDWDEFIGKGQKSFYLDQLVWLKEELGCHPVTRVSHILVRGNYEEYDEYNFKSLATATNIVENIGFLPMVMIKR
ncbi:6-hydroxymethylpterin diphosphokinase MptE-like protein [Sporosarcina sp. FSL K6-2383]|uniref:6-hydroxymethylpterin diphosphokinase MptE-like protein n=1 Tax=Sporosarcina sp. FSL K6-2383 TaxID=2921556 RepID=UPI00315AD8E5